MCLDPNCIRKLEKKTIILEKSLRQRNLHLNDLVGQIDRYFFKKIKSLIQLSNRSGSVISGKLKTIKNNDVLGIVLFSKQHKNNPWKNNFDQKPIYCIPISSMELGGWLGKGPRMVIGILPNRHLQKLNDYLQLWGKLR